MLFDHFYQLVISATYTEELTLPLDIGNMETLSSLSPKKQVVNERRGSHLIFMHTRSIMMLTNISHFKINIPL